ncbi:MAG: hypothetical protein ACJA2H_001349 [Nitriliruptoraceae bacterium]|jgi:hypothetical protein
MNEANVTAKAPAWVLEVCGAEESPAVLASMGDDVPGGPSRTCCGTL